MNVKFNNQEVNISAKIIALIFGLLNISGYIILVAIFFISESFLDRLITHINGIAILTYGSFIVSLITASIFNIVPKEKKVQTALIYSVLLIFNLLTLLLYYSLGHWSEGDTWLH
jgi:Na+-transporting NADH:ubiquinone oxidoreductase subunit NqrB